MITRYMIKKYVAYIVCILPGVFIPRQVCSLRFYFSHEVLDYGEWGWICHYREAGREAKIW